MKHTWDGLCLFLLLTLFSNAYPITIKVGILAYNPPFEVLAQNSNKGKIFFGFDAAIMKEVCKRIHAECTFENYLFRDLFSQVAAGDIDLAIGAIIITPERREKFLFSLPYKQSRLQYMVLANAPYQEIKDLTGKKLGVYDYSPAMDSALQFFNHDIQLVRFKSSMDMQYALNEQEVDGIITNASQAKYWVTNDTDYRALGASFVLGEGYGIMARRGREELIDDINQALLSMEKDGTYLSIYERNF